jgi:hypothetical protein
MSEEKLNNEAQNAELEKIQKVKESLNKIQNKDSKFIYTIPEIENPSASVYEIYFHATVAKKMGYKVIILTEKEDYEKPKWIENELLDHEHVPMSNNKLTVGPEDIMIIPEVFSNVMEQTKNLPCMRVGLLQSVDYMLNALVPGTDWSAFGIKNIITTSQTLKDFIETFYSKNKFNVSIYNPSIPNYFKRDDKPQKPVISVIGRNPNEISKFVKLFYTKYPQYSWITFDPMLTKSKPAKPMRRKDFAERLKGNFAAVWVDRISSWGTFPLECMKSGVIPVGLIPDITPEYLLDRDENGEINKMKENVGIWSNNFYDLPTLLGEALIKFLDDNIGDDLYDNMENIALNYTPEKSEEQIINVYNNLIEERKKVFHSAIEPTKNDTKK